MQIQILDPSPADVPANHVRFRLIEIAPTHRMDGTFDAARNLSVGELVDALLQCQKDMSEQAKAKMRAKRRLVARPPKPKLVLP